MADPPPSSPPPSRHLFSFLPRLIDAFGIRFVLTVICVYGLNQGVGEGFAYYAEQYLLTDELPSKNGTGPFGMGLTASQYAEVDGVSSFPWHIKALFGVASDLYPIRGYHRSPYILMAAVSGVIAWSCLWLARLTIPTVGVLLVLANLSIAAPDVMIDASITERTKVNPALGADLQTLCWGSFGVFKILSLAVAPTVYRAWGSRALMGMCLPTAIIIMIPACSNWLGERPAPLNESSVANNGLRQALSDSVAGPLIKLAVVITAVSFGVSGVALKTGSDDHLSSDDKARAELTLAFLSLFVATPVVCGFVWRYLASIDAKIAKAAIYVFLTGSLQPSAPVLFYWMKADEQNCAAKLPCFSPQIISALSMYGYVFFTLATLLYSRYVAHWSYRTIFRWTQMGIFFIGLLDLVWVSRINIKYGISDLAFVLGDEILSPLISRWNTLPFLVMAARLSPHGSMAATSFALFMGLSNAGSTMGEFFGVGLMSVFHVDRHQYDALPEFIATRTVFRLLPICLIPFLIPLGSPSDPDPNEDEDVKQTAGAKDPSELIALKSSSDARTAGDAL